MKEKFKSYSFWMSVTAAVILVINNIGKVFGFTVDNSAITNIIDSVCGVFVVFGILTMPNKKEDTSIIKESTNPEQIKEETKQQIENKKEDSADNKTSK